MCSTESMHGIARAHGHKPTPSDPLGFAKGCLVALVAAIFCWWLIYAAIWGGGG